MLLFSSEGQAEDNKPKKPPTHCVGGPNVASVLHDVLLRAG